jgi:hypothetical protein
MVFVQRAFSATKVSWKRTISTRDVVSGVIN